MIISDCDIMEEADETPPLRTIQLGIDHHQQISEQTNNNKNIL